MTITPWLVNWEARPHFAATYCSLILRIHLRRYYMILCWFVPKHQKDFSHLFHIIIFFFSSPQLGSHKFSSADYFLLLSLILAELSIVCTHKAFAALHIIWSLPWSHIVTQCSICHHSESWEKCSPSHPCNVSGAALTPIFPSQKERKATTKHTNFY